MRFARKSVSESGFFSFLLLAGAPRKLSQLLTSKGAKIGHLFAPIFSRIVFNSRSEPGPAIVTAVFYYETESAIINDSYFQRPGFSHCKSLLSLTKAFLILCHIFCHLLFSPIGKSPCGRLKWNFWSVEIPCLANSPQIPDIVYLKSKAAASYFSLLLSTRSLVCFHLCLALSLFISPTNTNINT